MTYDKHPSADATNAIVSTQYQTHPGTAVDAIVSPQYDTSPSGVSPLTILGSNLLLWVDGDHVTDTGDGTVITAITDLSGNANADFIHASAVTADYTTFNGHKSIKVETGGYWTHPGAVVSVGSGTDKPWTVFASMRLITTGVIHYSGCWGSSTADRRDANFLRATGLLDMANRKVDDAASATTVDGTALIDAGPHVYTWQQSGVAVSSWIDGVADMAAVSQNKGATTCDRFSIGAFLNAGTPTATTRAYFRTIIVANSAVSAAQRQAIEAYMANDAA